MIRRSSEETVKQIASTFPVVVITGPRQSGKTTLARSVFASYNYCNLEHPEIRMIAEEDPKSLLEQYPPPVIFDEVQRVPALLSYIQVEVDERKENGTFVLTGSHQFSLNASNSQSLAGRAGILRLLPFSLKELIDEGYTGQRDDWIFRGFMPRIYDQQQDPVSAYRNYLHTYIERDVRQLIQIKDLTRFQHFLMLLAGRIGQVVNVSSLASDVGVSSPTISDWLSVLEASFIIHRLPPYFENFGKRLIRSPKLYFVDVGLACYLLGIEKVSQVSRDPLLGGLFENMVVMEAIKSRMNQGLDPNFYFFRDHHQKEVDLIYRRGRELLPVEIKASMTYNKEYKKNIDYFARLTGQHDSCFIVYGGDQAFSTGHIQVLPFHQVYRIINKAT